MDSEIFYADFKPTNQEKYIIQSIIETSHLEKIFHLSLKALFNAATVKLAVIIKEGHIASFCFYSERSWQSSLGMITGISVGLVTTNLHFRRKGLAQKLLNNLTNLSLKQNYSFVYLQGIPEFYSKFGFIGFSPKSKVVLDAENFKKYNCTIRPLSKIDYSSVKSIFESYALSIGVRVHRTDREWADLFGPLSETFLFYHPMIILDQNGEIIGYFCTTPGNPMVIREVVLQPRTESTLAALGTLAEYVKTQGQRFFEIFTPARGVLFDLCVNNIGADFICFYRPRSSNMVKFSSFELVREWSIFNRSFILQGDNL